MIKNYAMILSWLVIFMPVSICIGKAVADINLTIVAVLFIVYSIVQKDWYWLQEKWIKIALVLWIYIVIRSLFVDNVWFSLEKAVPWIRYIVFAACMQFLVSQQKGVIKKIWISLTIAASFLAADTLLQFFTGYDIIGRSYFNEGDGTLRLTGPYSKKIVGFMITGLSLPVMAVIAFEALVSRNIIQILCCAILVAAIYLAVFLSGERSAFIQMNIGVIIILCFLNSHKKTILGFITIAVTIITAVFVTNPFLINRQIYSLFDTVNHFSSSPYGMLWIAGIKIGVAHPIFGVGSRYFERFCSQYSSFCSYHPHNIYVEWFAEYGLIGFGLFLYLFYTILK